MNSNPRAGADDGDIFAQLPEEDAVAQATPAIPDEELAEEFTAQSGTVPTEADPADAWEQTLPVPGLDDDAYEHVAPDERRM